MLGCMKHKLESWLPGEIKYADDTSLMAENKELEPFDEIDRREWKSWLKAQHSEN